MESVFLLVGLLGLDGSVAVQVAAHGLLLGHLLPEDLVVEVLVPFVRELALHVDDTGVHRLVEGPPALLDPGPQFLLVLFAEVALAEVVGQPLDLEVPLLDLIRKLEEGAFLLVVQGDLARGVPEGPGQVAVGILLRGDAEEVLRELPSGGVVVEAQVEGGAGGADEPLHLSLCRVAAGGDEDGLLEVPVPVPVELVVGHRVVGALEDENPLRSLQRGLHGGSDPQAEAAVATGCLALVRLSVASRPAPLLEPNNGPVTSGNGEREGEVPHPCAFLPGDAAVRQDEALPEGDLGQEVQPTVLEEGIERLEGIVVFGIDPVKSVVLHVEGLQLRLRFLDRRFLLLIRGVQEPVADLVHELVEVHPGLVLREELRVLLDERDDVVVLLDRGMEAELPVPGDDELVPADPLPVLVQTDVGGVAQAVLPVADVAHIPEDILHGEPLHVVLIREFHLLNPPIFRFPRRARRH